MANLFDNFSEREIEEVARVNAGAFYGMMGRLSNAVLNCIRR